MNELKLMKGNYFQLIDDSIMIVVNVLNDTRVVECTNVNGTALHRIDFDNIKPIPHTLGVLDKCPQFANKTTFGYGYRFSLNDSVAMVIYFLDGHCRCDIGDDIELIDIPLHQLQNLITCLTNTELIVNF